MIPELGHLALTLALAVAILQTVLPLIGASRGVRSWVALAVPAARWQFALVAFSYVCLTYVFVHSDFSVRYAWINSNTELPLIYKISGVWGAHEGSLLLWILMLNLWAFLVTLFSRSVPVQVVARVVSVMGFVSVGFLLFTLLTSNPFERWVPPDLHGRDLNPLLQDPGLAIHPPMLYMGYVGFSVAFAFAIAAMLGGRLDAAWARWARPWTAMAWVFLTVGIMLGSWWAYYELGWGGWWFWDPVENASFMPWLVGTALIHSLAATEKRGAFKSWTVLLAVVAFSLSLLGTFLVRSGVLTSVHAFASDPERGMFILVFLAVVVGLSLALFAWRAPDLVSNNDFELQSKESALLLNNVLLVIAALMVLGGTLFPLIMEAINEGKYSVGPPYFDRMFSWLMVPLLMLMGIGPLLRWRSDKVKPYLRVMVWPALAAVVLGGAWVAMVAPSGLFQHVSVALGVALGIWITASVIYGLYKQVRNRSDKWAGLLKISRSFWGMSVAHLGVAMFTIGVCLVYSFSVEKDIAIKSGDSYQLDDYEMRFAGVSETPGPNYTAQRGRVEVWQNGQMVTTLEPEKRVYLVQTMPMTEAAIDAGFKRDLYVALGEPLGGGSWALRIYYKPYVRWVWLGCLVMAFGGLLSISDRRYRSAKRVSASHRAAAVALGDGEARA